MKKGFILMCIVMSLLCMFSCAGVLAMKTQGIAVEVFGAQVSPALVGGLLMLFAVLFLLLAAKVAFKKKRNN